MSQTSTDRIEKQITLRAPRSRVWRALSQVGEFNAWFGVKLEGDIVPGATLRGKITHPEYAHVTLELVVDRVEPERLFSYRWHPHAVDAAVDYSKEPMTTVEFRLDEAPEGTLLTIVESGFDRLPAARRDLAFRANGGGWTAQAKNLEAHVARG